MLKLVIDKLEDVPEALRDYYKETNGKFLLQAEGMKTQADIDRQLAANQAERTAHKTTKDALKAATDKLVLFGDLDPDDVQAKLEKLTTLEAAGTNPKADEIQRLVQAGVDARVKTETQKLQRSLDAVTKERDEAVVQVGGLSTKITQRGIDDEIRSAAVAAKVIPESVLDLTTLARSDFKLVDGKVVTEDGRTPAQWLDDRKKTSPFFWPAAKGAGAGGGPAGGGQQAGDNPFSYAGWNLTKQGALVRSDAARATQLATEAGTTVGGKRPAAPAAAK